MSVAKDLPADCDWNEWRLRGVNLSSQSYYQTINGLVIVLPDTS